MKLGSFGTAALLLAGSLCAVAIAQTAPPAEAPANPLNLPANPTFVANTDPGVRKATAIVNGTVITGTDVEQRLALIVIANGGQIPAEELERLRAQVLRNLVDETLQIQAAEADEIKVEPAEIERYYEQYAQNLRQSVPDFRQYLRTAGSSEASIKRQIHGEIAWTRLQRRQIEPFVNVGEEEVQQIIERLKASKGAQEYRVSEIFLASTPENAAEVRANAARIVQQIRQGASFLAYARQFSEASTAAVGGDLGWVRAEQLPEPLAETARAIPVGQVSDPIAVPGGYSIVAVADTRQVLTADPRDAVLSLKQISIKFPAGSTEASTAPAIQNLVRASQSMGGCGGADALQQSIGAEVVSSDQVKVRDLPRPLQEMLLQMNIGQSTAPFGTLQDGVRVLVLCGRDEPAASDGPSFAQVSAQLNEQRVNRRAQRLLRDLRRDAVVDYR